MILAGPEVGTLNTPTLAGLLALSISILAAVFYSMLRGKLRPESALKEAREDAASRVGEARQDRDDRLAEAARQIDMWKNAYELAEEARRSQEALLRETTMEIGRTVQHVIGALQDARAQAERDGHRDSREYTNDA